MEIRYSVYGCILTKFKLQNTYIYIYLTEIRIDQLTFVSLDRSSSVICDKFSIIFLLSLLNFFLRKLAFLYLECS